MRDSLGSALLHFSESLMRRGTPLLLFLAAVFTAECQDSSGLQPLISVDDLTGSWVMLTDTAIGVTDTTKKLDLIAHDSIAWDTLAVGASGAALNSFRSKSLIFVDTVTFTLTNGTLKWQFLRSGAPSGSPLTYTLVGAGNDMRWLGTYTLSVDLDNDGVADSARERIRWHRH
jgi:hypothetical protein